MMPRPFVAMLAVLCLFALAGCANMHHMAYVEQQVQASAGSPLFGSLAAWEVRPTIQSRVQGTPLSKADQRFVTDFAVGFDLPCSSDGYKGYDHDEYEVRVTRVSLQPIGGDVAPIVFPDDPVILRSCTSQTVGKVTLPAEIEQVRLSFTYTLIVKPGARQVAEQFFVVTMRRTLEKHLAL